MSDHIGDREIRRRDAYNTAVRILASLFRATPPNLIALPDEDCLTTHPEMVEWWERYQSVEAKMREETIRIAESELAYAETAKFVAEERVRKAEARLYQFDPHRRKIHE